MCDLVIIFNILSVCNRLSQLPKARPVGPSVVLCCLIARLRSMYGPLRFQISVFVPSLSLKRRVSCRVEAYLAKRNAGSLRGLAGSNSSRELRVGTVFRSFPTFFHVLMAPGGLYNVSQDQIDKQIAVLNAACKLNGLRWCVSTALVNRPDVFCSCSKKWCRRFFLRLGDDGLRECVVALVTALLSYFSVPRCFFACRLSTLRGPRWAKIPLLRKTPRMLSKHGGGRTNSTSIRPIWVGASGDGRNSHRTTRQHPRWMALC